MCKERRTTMLGTEYNWLIESTVATNGTPKVRLASSVFFTLWIAVFCFLCVALQAAPSTTTAAGDQDVTSWTLTAMDGIIEGIAIHPVTREAFCSDVRNRCIWYRDTTGAAAVMRKFSAATDGLLGVFALKFSADGGTLWASTSALPEMIGYAAADQDRGFLAAYDFTTRKLRATYALPRDARRHVLGDFVLAPDGMIYASDSTAPVIWRLSPGGQQLEKWLENPEFKSLQGLVMANDGKSLWVADYGKGLWQITLATRDAVLLPAPANSNLRGIDGIYAAPSGGWVAVQNGTKTQRLLRIALDDSGMPVRVTELLSGHPAMTDLGLGQTSEGRFHFVATSGWELYPTPSSAPAARDVIILNVPLN
jgi:sugar lactone lactonase YvrE